MRDRGERLHPAIDELDDPSIAGHDRLHGCQRPADGHGLPRPRGAQRRVGERIDREERGRLAAQRPRRSVVGGSQPLQARADGWLAEHEAHPRGRGRGSVPAGARATVAEGPDRGRARDREHGRRRPLPQRLEVLAEACLERAQRAALEALDEAADRLERFLEREPRVAFPPLGGRWEADVPAGHPQGATATGTGRESARRDDRVEQGETQRGQDRRRAQVRLDPFHDRGQGDELARRVQVEQLVDETRRALDRREPVAGPGPGRLEVGVGGGAHDVVGLEGRLALLGPAALVAAHGASVVAGHGAGRAPRRRWPT